jgi:hypothetical protein
MLLKVYKSRVWMLLLMLMPFISYAQPASWNPTLNPTSAVYAIPLDVAVNAPLEALSAGDWVGTFFDDDGTMVCAGMVEWTGTENVAVVAFGNDTIGTGGDKNGFDDGDMVHWVIWYAGTDTEVCALSTPEFAWHNTDLGQVTAFSGCDDVCEQTLSFTNGWNWVSFNVLPEMTDLNSVLGIEGYTAGDFIQTAGISADYYDGFGWFGALTDIDPDNMYQLNLAVANEITVIGACVDVADPINLAGGWNWIGYKPQASSLINDALASMTPTANDFIQTAGVSADYYEGFGWFGALEFMDPGKGYQVKLASADVLVYPETDMVYGAIETAPAINTAKFSKENPNWPVPPTFPFYQNVKYQVFIEGVAAENAGSQLSAWKDGEIRALATLLAPPPIPGALYHYSVNFGSEVTYEEGFTFMFYDAGTGEVYDITETHTFENGINQGTIFDPLPLNCIVSETIDICGTVTDAVTTDPIEGATITATAAGGATGNPNWPTPPTFPFYQNVKYQVFLDGVAIEAAGSQLSAWVGDDIRALATVLAPPPIPGALYHYSVNFGSELTYEEGFTFKFYDAGADMVYDIVETHTFENGINLGTIFDPIPLTASGGGGETYTATTGADGTYCMNDVAAGTYTIGATAVGYFGQEVEDVVVEASVTQDFALVPEVTCEDAVINNWPLGQEDVCFGTDLVIDFENVEILNAQSTEWLVVPVQAGVFDGTDFVLDEGYIGPVTITLNAYAFEDCMDATAELMFTVNPLPEVICPEDFGVCYTVGPITLTGATPEDGEYSGAGVVDGVFDPLMGVIGENEITYTYTDDNGCTNFCTYYITLYDLPSVTCPESFAVCIDAAEFELTGAAPAGGEYSGVGVADGMFDPTVAGVGEHAITYTYTDIETGCSNWCELWITVNPLPEPVCPVYEPVCAGSEAFEFPVVDGGIYTNAAMEVVTGFDPMDAGEFFFTLTVTDGNGCVGSCGFSILVNANPEPVCPENYFACAGEGYIEFPVVENGVYTDEGGEPVQGFDPMEAGVYFFTLTVTENNCFGTCMFEVEVMGLPVPDAGADAAIEAGETYTLEGSVSGEEPDDFWWWETSGDGTFTPDAFALDAVYTPGEDDLANGSAELCLYVTSFYCGVDIFDCMTLTIGEIPCENAEILEWPATPENLCAGSVLEIDFTGVEILNAESYEYIVTEGAGEWGDGVFFLDPAFVGMVNIQLNAYAVAPCDDAMAMMEFEVYPLPWLDLMLSAEEICLGESVEATVTGPEDGAYPYTVEYTLNGEAMTDVVEETPLVQSYTPEAAGEYTLEVLSIMDANGCYADMGTKAIYTLVVNPLPFLEMELSATEICLGEAVTATITGPEDGAYPYFVEFNFNGEFNDDVIDGTPLVVEFVPEEAGEYVLEVLSIVDENGCYGDVEGLTFSLMVNPLPEVAITLSATELCVGEILEVTFTGPEDGAYPYQVEYLLAGVPATFPMNESVVVISAPIPEGEWVVEGVGVTDLNGCYAPIDAMFTIVVNPLPYIMLELSATEICLGEEVLGTITGPEDGAYPYTVEYTINGEPLTGVIDGTPLEIPLVPEMAGTYTLAVQSVVDANGCWAAPVEGVELVVLPAPEITTQPMSQPVPYNGTATFTVVADYASGYQWFGPDGEILGATGASLTIENVMPEDAGDYYVMVYGCGEVMSEMATLTVEPWEQCIDLLASYNGVSTYLNLEGFEDQVGEIFGAPLMLNAVEFYAPSMVYVPGGTSFPWDESKGAKVSLTDGYPTEVCVEGYPTLGYDLTMPAGWSLMPVWAYDVVTAASVFEPMGDNLIAVFSMDYAGIYWPAYNIYTLDLLVPGSAYLVALAAPGAADFDVPPADAIAASHVPYPRNLTSWNDVKLSGEQHNIAITASALENLQVGDVIGAFNQNATAVGMVEVTSLNQNIALRVYGATEGDVLTFQAYRDGEIIELDATFDTNLPSTNVFTKEGMSAITSFKAGVTSINNGLTSDLTANLYPNPATQFVNIETNFEIKNLTVVNYVGQVVFDRDTDQMTYQINTSNFNAGMYFVQIQSVDGTVITKRLTVN